MMKILSKGFLFSFAILLQEALCQHRVAIIGAGVAGTFSAKYLAEYDRNCTIDEFKVFEAVPLDGPVPADGSQNGGGNDWQGSRVTSVKLVDGSIIEIGASIGYAGFHHVLEMIRGDPKLQIGKPFSTGAEDQDHERTMGIYAGEKQWPLRTSIKWPKFLNKMLVAWRYGHDLVRVSNLLKQAEEAFALVPHLLKSTRQDTFFQSPDEIWDRIGLVNAVNAPFASLLDVLGVDSEISWWRQFLPYQGSLREELLTAVNFVNYNQDVNQVNGIVGLGSLAAIRGTLFSLVGGNHRVTKSAMEQAQTVRTKYGCKSGVQQLHKTITHVIGSFEGLTLYAGGEELGQFDAVVLAAPLHQSRIEFLVQSKTDSSVLQPMPLGGLIDSENGLPDDHEGHSQLPGFLPDSAQRPYTQVVTTVYSHGKLQHDLIGLEEDDMPRSILVTSTGKASFHNITAITRIHQAGIYKTFSNEVLSDEIKTKLFGPDVKTEYVMKWGGKFGGATPDYRGRGDSTGFLLYDSSVGVHGHTKSGALYYPNAMELSSLACMEMSAVGSKATAKLIALRFGWIETDTETKVDRDEL